MLDRIHPDIDLNIPGFFIFIRGKETTRQTRWLKEGVVVSIVLLFVGVAFSPSIDCSIVQASVDDDLIEITTTAYGVTGFENQTQKLTQQQYEALRRYLIGFNTRLNISTSKRETVEIFKEAIVELNTYGLLPAGMSILQAQHLVTGRYKSFDRMHIFGQTSKEKTSENITNYFCLLAGYSNTVFWSAFMLVWFFLLFNLDNFLNFLPLLLHLFMNIILIYITMGLMGFDYLRPLMLWGDIDLFGNGSLFTIGLNGIKTWVGNLSGDINGFTGIKIKLGLQEPMKYFFLGSAVKVQVAPSDP